MFQERHLIALPLLLFLAGCVHHEPTEQLDLALPAQFSLSGTLESPQQWWYNFEDPQLDHYITQALAENLTLASAYERMLAAGAIVNVRGADLFPKLDATAKSSYRDGDEISGQSSYQLGLAASYEIDLWGRIRSSVQASELRFQATKADYKTLALSLSAQVAQTWFSLLEANERLALLKDQIAANEKVLTVLNARYRNGTISQADVLRQERLLESTRESALINQQQIQLRENQLSTLLGKATIQNIDSNLHTLPTIPPLPQTGLPAELLMRRPDVRAAWLEMKATNKDLAAAVSNQYPRLNLLAGIETAAEKPTDLFEDWIGSIAGGLIAPLLDGGLRQAQATEAAALQRAAVLDYGQVMLEAMEAVEASLIREQTAAARVANLQRQVSLAEKTYTILQERYLGGSSDYISTLSSLTQLQSLQRSLLSARLDLLNARINLYRNLSGGFEVPPHNLFSQ